MDQTEKKEKKKKNPGTYLVIQWLRLHAFTAGGTRSILGLGKKISHAARQNQKQTKIQKLHLCLHWNSPKEVSSGLSTVFQGNQS